MKALARLLTIAGLVASLGCLASAADVQGILLDRMCSGDIVAAKDQKAAKGHTRECGLMEDCVKVGYGVFTTDGKFITFDKTGNQKANQALKASSKKDDIQVQVTGELSGDSMKVAAIKIL